MWIIPWLKYKNPTFNIDFSFWKTEYVLMVQIQDFFRSTPKRTEIWSEKVLDLSHLGPIWPILGPNLVTQLYYLFSFFLLTPLLEKLGGMLLPTVISRSRGRRSSESHATRNDPSWTTCTSIFVNIQCMRFC